MPRIKPNAARDDLAAVNLSIAKAKLTKLEAELPKPAPREFTRYEDLPPLCLEDRERLKADLIAKLRAAEDRYKREQHDWYMSMAHHAP